MGTITSSVGLISGLDYQSLIDKLIAIEAEPVTQLQTRISTIDAQRTAFKAISAQISGMLSKILSLKQSSFFTANKVTSSNTSVLSASVSSSAAAGSYNFIVKSLATTHQLVSRGYTSRDAQLQAGELLIESARARVNSSTSLDVLNGYGGVERGSFDLIDAAGHSARIDISNAATLSDVVDRINAAGIDVSARMDGDQLVLKEANGGVLRVREVDGGRTAADLGFGSGNTSSGNGTLTGTNLMYLTSDTPLSALNDGNGVSRAYGLSDFQINDITVKFSEILDGDTDLRVLNRGRGVESGVVRVTTEDDDGELHQTQVDLRGLSTVGEIKDALEGAMDGVTVTMANNQLRVGYTSGGSEKTIQIEDVSGHAARDLGINQSSDAGRINGKAILNMDTVGAVVAAINYAAGNDGSVTAAVDGTRLTLTGTGDMQISALNNSQALFDLGLTEGTFTDSVSSRRIIGGVDSTLLSTLNGGKGFQTGRITMQVGDESMTLDLTGAETLQDVIDRINDAAETEDFGIQAGYDRTGTRLIFESTDGASPITITDAEGTFAADLGLTRTEGETSIRSNNLQKQYVSGATRLDDLNGGRGTTLGTIQIKNSRGLTVDVELGGNSNISTLQDVINQINMTTSADGSAFGVTARINDNGDGIVIEDAAGGTLDLEVSDLTGTAAQNLHIAGTSAEGVIDGTQEINIQLSGGETLDEVVELINEHGGLVTAGVLNDGTGAAPYRLQLSSAYTGKGGELIVDGLGFTTMTTAQDAQVLLGNNPSSGLIVSSATNTIEDIVPGVTLDLTSPSDDPVTVVVQRDLDSIVSLFTGIVDGFNGVMTSMDNYTSYDTETESAGVLLGDRTALSIESRLQKLIMTTRENPVGNLRRLSDFGIKFSDGALALDADKLRSVLTDNLDGAIDFFTDEDQGMAAVLQEKLEYLTDSDGLIERYDGMLSTKQDQMNDRVDTLNDRLERRREQLLKQFLAMESALAQMQTQQNALTNLAALSGTTSSSSSS